MPAAIVGVGERDADRLCEVFQQGVLTRGYGKH